MIRDAKARVDELSSQAKAKDDELRGMREKVETLERQVVGLEKVKEELEVEKARILEDLLVVKEVMRWLVTEGLSRVVEAVRGSDEFSDGVVGLNGAAEAARYHDGLMDGFQVRKDGLPLESLPGWSPDARTILTQRQDIFDTMKLPGIQTLPSLADQPDLKEIRDVLSLED
ncbi:hypothetical protein L1987_37451 [Smallanthus sonchifolius]|uniref:Uncharacterized protein n=1 Tax=Smallanthus sonchifolius TaxID=185202 RepID=A0ACB9HGC4_9ASTR|nr:hypothetical protein L1987_37451 [Smallanthus sonchifolius]